MLSEAASLLEQCAGVRKGGASGRGKPVREKDCVLVEATNRLSYKPTLLTNQPSFSAGVV